jgi:cystathionine beta-lyase
MVKNMKNETKYIHAGRSKKWTKGIVNPPIFRASTVVYDTVAEMKAATKNIHKNELFYGRKGTDTHFALMDAMKEIEGCAGAWFYPSGLGACTGAITAFVKTGDHILVTDSVYEPTKKFCKVNLKNMGVKTEFYDPMAGASIEELIRPNTSVIFVEAPGSVTMEVQDIPAIVKAAKKHNIVVILDNTWATPVLFDAYGHGVDVVVHAATKYFIGHSDAMIGIATANETHWPKLRDHTQRMGYCASADDAYMVLRGIRTLRLRLKQHEENALKVAHFLKKQDIVDKVFHPAFKDCPGHKNWKRDFSGASGLFSFTFNCGGEKAMTAMLDQLELFNMGFSWGGYESLAMGLYDIKKTRDATSWDAKGPLLRLHVGLEDPEDLIADLEQGLEAFKQAL